MRDVSSQALPNPNPPSVPAYTQSRTARSPSPVPPAPLCNPSSPAPQQHQPRRLWSPPPAQQWGQPRAQPVSPTPLPEPRCRMVKSTSAPPPSPAQSHPQHRSRRAIKTTSPMVRVVPPLMPQLPGPPLHRHSWGLPEQQQQQQQQRRPAHPAQPR